MNAELIGPLQKEILMKLYKSKDELHVNELARQLKKSPVTVSISLKQLADRNIISTNEASRGKVKTLKIEGLGKAALFAYCNVDPVEYFAKTKEKAPEFVDYINRLFIDKDMKQQTFRNVFASLLSDTWSVSSGDKVIRKMYAGWSLTSLITIAEVAKELLRTYEGVVSKQEYFKYLDWMLGLITKYVQDSKKELSQ